MTTMEPEVSAVTHALSRYIAETVRRPLPAEVVAKTKLHMLDTLAAMLSGARLKPGAIVVNTARGGIVDEAALVLALADGRVAAAGLDVLDDEPPAKDHPLLAYDQVVLSPHIAGLTQQAAERMAAASVQNVIDFFEGRIDPALIVNKDF